MQRIALPAGAVIQLNNRDYTINKLIGDGATCMVYSAHYTDVAGYPHQVNLKECYPYHAEIRRDQQNMLWQSSEEKAQSLSAFRQAYDKLMTWQNNSTVKAFDMCEANNTLYIVMNADQGQPFDQDTGRSLHELLQTALALTKTVQKYHNNGYLHLDIKPSNFLTIPETRELVILFDLDTVTSINDVRSGNIRCVSYSDGWAAPEQKQGNLAKVGPATDIFAIGATLFEKVMGRQVMPEDMSIFSNWDFTNELFDDVNPKIKRILRNIFQKTLAANTKRRYQSTAELTEVLVTACEVASARQFIVAPELQIPAHFIGRDMEINKIHSQFQNGNKAVFLHGIGGIGKSTLAVAYALSHKEDYDTILFCRYKTSLEDLLDDLVDEIQNFEGDTKEGRRKLKTLLDKNTLIIIDNFDIATDKEPYLHQFLKLNAKLLFTTRTDFASQLSMTSAQLDVSPLPYAQLEALFSHLSHVQVNTVEKQNCLHDLLRVIDYHTYVTELLARQIVASGWSLEILTRKVKDGLLGLATAEKVQATKDDSSTKQTIPEGLRVLFNLAALDEQRKQVLRNVYLLDQFTAISKDSYKLFCASTLYTGELRDDDGRLTWFHFNPYVPESSPDVDVINELVELGWIQEKYTLFSLHPLVAELVLHDLTPCQNNCTKFYEYMQATLLAYTYASTSDEADEKEQRNHFELLLDFLTHVDFNDSTNRKMAFDFLDSTIDLGVGFEEDWIVEPECEIIAEKLLAVTLKANDNWQERFHIYLLLFKMRSCTARPKDNDDLWSKLVFADYDNIIRILDAFNPEEKQRFEKTLWAEIKFILYRLPDKFVQYAYTNRPEMFVDWDAARKYAFGLPVSEQEWAEFAQQARSSFGQGGDHATEEVHKEEDTAAEEARENWINEMYQKFRQSDNKLLFAKNLRDDYDLEIYEVVALLLNFCERIFVRVSRHQGHCSEQVLSFVKDTNWCEIEKIMDYAEELQKSAQWKKSYDGYDLDEDAFYAYSETKEPCRRSICDTLLCRAFLDVILGNWSGLDQKIAEGIPLEYAYYHHIVWYTLPEWQIASACWNLGKCHNIVPYLLNWLDKYEDSSFDERQHISVFENIVIYAQKAAEEVSDDPEQVELFQRISNDFTNRINSITGKKYMLKRDLDQK